MRTDIVKLVGFLVANLCHDDAEWKDWGLPFLELLLHSQKCPKIVKTATLKSLNEMFSTLVDSKQSLVCEEGEGGFIVLHVGSDWWEEMMQKGDLEGDLAAFLRTYIKWAGSEGKYDARARVVARKLYDTLQSPEKFGELENKVFESLHQGGRGSSSGSGGGGDEDEDEEVGDFVLGGEGGDGRRRSQQRLGADDEDDEGIETSRASVADGSSSSNSTSRRNRKAHRASTIRGTVTERVWKVSLAATVGATLMSLAAVATAPAILDATLVLLGDSSLSQFLLGMTALMTSYGVTSGGVMGTVGAYSATIKMLHRTEPLQEFKLDHLLRRPSQPQQAEGEPPQGGAGGGASPSPSPSAPNHAPIYLLVPGHCNYNPELKNLRTAAVAAAVKAATSVPLQRRPSPSPSPSQAKPESAHEEGGDAGGGGQRSNAARGTEESSASSIGGSGVLVPPVTQASVLLPPPPPPQIMHAGHFYSFTQGCAAAVQTDRDVWGADPLDYTDDLEIIGSCGSAAKGGANPPGGAAGSGSGAGAGTGTGVGGSSGHSDQSDLSEPDISYSADDNSISAVAARRTAAALRNISTEHHKHQFLFETTDRYDAYAAALSEENEEKGGENGYKLRSGTGSTSSAPAVDAVSGGFSGRRAPRSCTGDGDTVDDDDDEAAGRYGATMVSAGSNSSQATSGGDDINSQILTASWDVVSAEDVHAGWWKQVISHGDEYLLQWDRHTRDELSASLHEFISTKGLTYMTKELLMFTPVATLLSAATLPWLISNALDGLDSPWALAIDKARHAGRILAMTLLMQHEYLHDDAYVSTWGWGSGSGGAIIATRKGGMRATAAAAVKAAKGAAQAAASAVREILHPTNSAIPDSASDSCSDCGSDCEGGCGDGVVGLGEGGEAEYCDSDGESIGGTGNDAGLKGSAKGSGRDHSSSGSRRSGSHSGSRSGSRNRKKLPSFSSYTHVDPLVAWEEEVIQAEEAQIHEADQIASIRAQLRDMISNEADIEAALRFITLAPPETGSKDATPDAAAGGGERDANSSASAPAAAAAPGDTSSGASTSTRRPKRPRARPITLIGYGIGARVIIHCLETLVAELKAYPHKAYIRGLVESVALMGAPYGTDAASWRELRSIIPGRFINCYSTKDWLLALMFRQCSWELGVAGLGPVDVDAPDMREEIVEAGSTAVQAAVKVVREAAVGLHGAAAASLAATMSPSPTAGTAAANDASSADDPPALVDTAECAASDAGDAHAPVARKGGVHFPDDLPAPSNRPPAWKRRAGAGAGNDNKIASTSSTVTGSAAPRHPSTPSPAPVPRTRKDSSAYIENVDVTPLIRSHSDYPNALQLIIPLLKLDT